MRRSSGRFRSAARRQLGLYLPSMWPSRQSEMTRSAHVAPDAAGAPLSADEMTTPSATALASRRRNDGLSTRRRPREKSSRRRWAGGGRGGGSRGEAKRRRRGARRNAL